MQGVGTGGSVATFAVFLFALAFAGCVAVDGLEDPVIEGSADEPVAETAMERIPCRDARGCPDLTVDPLHFYVGTQRVEHFGPEHCAVKEGAVVAGDRQILRLSFNTPNQGDGSLIIGAPEDNPGFFTHSDCHDHWHFDDFAHYRLWEATAYLEWDEVRQNNPEWNATQAFEEYPELAERMVAGHKQGFCTMDLAPAVPTLHGYAVPPDLLPVYGCTNQGISRGWADIYHWILDGQWIDVTDVAPGPYILEAETNPEHRVEESDYTNNRAVLPVVVLPLA